MLRTHGGVAPVTKQSGKRRQVVMRRGCNPRLRHALYHMARVALQRDAHCNRVYTALRAKGQRHGQALRNVGDRLLRILMGALGGSDTPQGTFGLDHRAGHFRPLRIIA